MNRGAIDEMRALDPDAVVVKGDLTDRGTAEEYEAFLAALRRARRAACTTSAATTTRCATRRWRVEGAPYAVELAGVTLAVLDTVVAGSRSAARSTREQLAWLDELAARVDRSRCSCSATTRVDPRRTDREPHYFGINPDDSEALLDVIARRETHRRLLRRAHPPQPRARDSARRATCRASRSRA